MRMATSAELAELNGILASLSARRAAAGDTRDKDAIVDELLDRVIAAPTIPAMLEQLRGLE